MKSCLSKLQEMWLEFSRREIDAVWTVVMDKWHWKLDVLVRVEWMRSGNEAQGLLTSLLFILQIHEYIVTVEWYWQWNLITRRDDSPSATFSTTNTTWIVPGTNPGLRGESRRLTTWATARPFFGPYWSLFLRRWRSTRCDPMLRGIKLRCKISWLMSCSLVTCPHGFKNMEQLPNKHCRSARKDSTATSFSVLTNSVAPEPEGSSPHSQQPATGPEPVESNPHPPPQANVPKIHSDPILPSTP
jgi:hypothetical protein